MVQDRMDFDLGGTAAKPPEHIIYPYPPGICLTFTVPLGDSKDGETAMIAAITWLMENQPAALTLSTEQKAHVAAYIAARYGKST